MKKFFVPIIIAVCLSGCAEGNFELSPDSRLPKWFTLPEGMTRDAVTVTMTTYLTPTEKSVFELRNQEGEVLSKVTGHRYDGYLYPKNLESSVDGYPSYEIVESNGVIDIIEHRKKQPVFFVSSNPDVWLELGVTQR